MNADAVIAPFWEEMATLRVHSAVERKYVLDCEKVLRKHELLNGATLVSQLADLQITDVRTRLGRYVEFTLKTMKGYSPHRDYVATFVASSQFGQVAVDVQLRVFHNG